MNISRLPLFILFFLIIACNAQDTWDKVEIKTNHLSDNVKMLEGRGGNIGVVVGDVEILIIDAQFEPIYEKIKASIGAISEKPVNYLLNTHWHGDHTGGNNKFNEDGALLVAHSNVKKRMSTNQSMEHFGREVPASPEVSQPEMTFEKNMTIDLGNEIVHFIHIENAHTDGDAIIHLPKSNVIHMGDTYFAGMYPFIDISSGGSVQGVINACESVLTLSDDNTVIIPGHGPMTSKVELTEYRNMLLDLLSKVKVAKAEGESMKEIIAKDYTDIYAKDYGDGFIQPKDIITFIYQSLQ